jgi:hypothetical protein
MWRLDLPWWFDQVAIRILRIKARHVPTDGCAGETGRFISGGSTHTVGHLLPLTNVGFAAVCLLDPGRDKSRLHGSPTIGAIFDSFGAAREGWRPPWRHSSSAPGGLGRP